MQFPFFFGFGGGGGGCILLIWVIGVIRQSGFYPCHYPCMQTLLALPLVLPSPPTHSLSLHHLHIQGDHLHSICQLSHLFVSLFLNSNERLMDIISTVFLGPSHNNSNCSQTHRSIGYCTCIFTISKTCAEA